MKKFIPFIIILLNVTSVFGQWKAQDYFKENYLQRRRILSVSVNNHFASNTIVSSFAWKYLRGSYLTEMDKEESINNFIKDNITVGERFNTGISYFKKLGDGPYFLGLEWSHNIFYETRVHNDIFNLLFKGNKIFEGKTASLSPLDIRLFQYSSFKVGIAKQAERFSFYCKLAFLGGHRYLELESNQGSLFTAPGGKAIDINLKLRSLDVSPETNSLFDFTGFGVQTEFGLDFKVSKRIGLYVDIENLGYIKWKNNLTERIVDTSYHFDGIEVTGILDSFSINIKDAHELKSQFIKDRKGLSEQINLPVIINFGLYQELIADYLKLGLRYQFIQSNIAKSLWGVNLDLKLNSRILIGADVSYGGYGKLNLGVKSGLSFFDRLFVETYFHSLNSLVTSKSPYAFIGGATARLGF